MSSELVSEVTIIISRSRSAVITLNGEDHCTGGTVKKGVSMWVRNIGKMGMDFKEVIREIGKVKVVDGIEQLLNKMTN